MEQAKVYLPGLVGVKVKVWESVGLSVVLIPNSRKVKADAQVYTSSVISVSATGIPARTEIRLGMYPRSSTLIVTR